MANGVPFGQHVRARRRELGLTQEELAHRVGCAPITLRRIEHDDLRPSVQIAERLAMALGIPLDERAAFVRLARAERAPEPLTPTPTPSAEEIGLEDLSGRAIRGYALGERLGEGGMGVVYRATQPLVEREVAIKIILPQYANQPDFIRRFEAEAQLIARLEHPHIVPLYDYWREPGAAYLIMRLLRGGSLRSLLEKGVLPLETISHFVEQISQALAAAHRIGVIHRDLKPANILLDEDSNAYLADFGIAKNLGNLDTLTQADAILGSPNYISPEQVRSESVRPQTDIYCLGIMLYELLTGVLPFQGPTPVVVMYKHITTPMPPLASQRPGLPAALDQVIARATAKDPLDRYPDADALLADWRLALGSLAAGPVRLPAYAKPLTDTDNPYKGLRAFAEGDAADFFGRDALIHQLLARMAEGGDLSRFLAVVGPSGCGKSSVVKAGLLPALRRGALPGSEQWFIIEMMPGAHPLEELEAALLHIAVNPPESLLGQLREEKRGLLRAVRRCLPDDSNVELVLVIDQFEELFTLLPDESARAHLLDSLVTAVLDERSRLRLVVTLRADFIDRPLNYVDFGELLRQRMELVLPFTPDELERAITGPAERLGLEWEAGLVPAIMHDVGDQPGALPLLQYALTGLFDGREDHRLTKAAYQAIGGVLGALGGRAEDIFRSLPEEAQRLTRQLFLRLATLGEGVGDGTLSPDTRRRVLRAELEALTPNELGMKGGMSFVIDAFGRSRLLAFDRDPVTRGPTVEVAHEALLREWPRLRDWLSASRADVRLQRQLAIAANEWQTANSDTGYLLAGPRLAQFEGWAAGTDVALTQSERAFLEASVAQRQAQESAEAERQRRELEAAKRLAETERRSAIRLRARNRVITAVGAVALLAALAALFFGFTSNQNLIVANHNAATAQAASTQAAVNLVHADSLRLAAEAGRNLAEPDGNVETAALLSIRAFRAGYLPQADETLQKSAPRLYALRTFAGHTGAVFSVAFSPDGKYILTGSNDKTARLWDAATTQEVRSFKGHAGTVWSVAFSPDGKYVLTGSEDRTAKLWDTATGHEVRTFAGHADVVWSAAFSPDGKYVLTGSEDSTAKLWEAATGAVVRAFAGHSGAVTCAAFSPDGKYVLSGSVDSTARLWDTATGAVVRTFAGHTGAVRSVAFSPDGKDVLTGSEDNTAKVWDAATGTQLRSFSGHNSLVARVAFSPDGTYVLTGSADATAKLWDRDTGVEVRTYSGHFHAVEGVAFSPDGKYVLTGSDDKTARLWSTPATRDRAAGASVRTYSSHYGLVNTVAFSPDGQYLLTSHLNVAMLWTNTLEAPSRFYQHTNVVWSAAFSPDGKSVVTGGNDKTAKLWDIGGWEIRTFTGHTGAVRSVAFSPDGKYILTGSNDKTARLWDAATAQEVRSFKGHAGTVWSVAFSPDGKYVLTGSEDRTAKLWDTATGDEVRTFAGHADVVWSAAFSPDGKYVLTGSQDSTAKLWEAATGAVVRTFAGHSGAVNCAAFSPDGKYVLTGSDDRTAKIWDTATGTQERVFTGHTDLIVSVAFSPDGQQVATGSLDGTARLWDVDYRKVVGWACAHLTRDLTPDERKQYDIIGTAPTCPAK